MRPDAKKKIATVTPKSGPNVVLIGAVIAVLVVLAVVVAIVIGNNSKAGSSTAAAQTVPAGVVGGTGGGILVSPATSKGTVPAKSNAPTLDVFEDFQCPSCGQLEKAMGSTFADLAKAGEVKLVVHTLSFLDDNLKNDSSKRSANAVACAADAGQFLPYHAAVFAAQPANEGDGYTDAQLTEFATTAGITGPALATWQKCTTSGQHNQYVADVATAAAKAEVNGTPTVKLNGKDITKTLSTPDALVAQVRAATK
jgi:protein-disulfide isomerase